MNSNTKKVYQILKTNYDRLDSERSAAWTEKHNFEARHLEELFVGKFWKKDNGARETLYCYCKSVDIPDNGYGYCLFDLFTISDEVNNDYVLFKRNFKEHVSYYCITEITRKEYDEAFEKFKHKFFDFTKVERIVLIEKNKRIGIL